MTWSTVTEIFGVAGVIAIALLAFAVTFYAYVTRENRRSDDEFQRGRTATYHELARWFSEDRPLSRALERLAQGQDITSVRAVWRKERRLPR